MSITDHDMDSTALKLSQLLSQPAEGDAPVEEAKVPVDPKPVRQTQRNTVAPQPQEVPSDEEISTEDEGEGSQDDSTQPPVSWDAEAKKLWAKLPDDVKAVVTARENDRENATKLKLEEAATIRKRAEALEADTTAARTAYEQRLVLLTRQLEATIPAEFQNIKSQQDLIALSSRDPAAYMRFKAWQEMVNGVVGEFRQLEESKKVDFVRKQNETYEREAKALLDKWPDVADPVKGPAFRTEISGLLKGYSFSDEEISGIADHRILLFARDYLNLKKAAKAHEGAGKKLEKKPLPKVTRPSAGEASGGPASLSKAQLGRVARSGDLSATQAAIERLLANPK